MSWLLVLPIVLPLATAVSALLARRSRAVQGGIGVGGSAALLAAGLVLLAQVWTEGILAAQVGGWPAPFGVTLVADHLSAVLVVVAGLVGLAVAVYALADIDEQRVAFGFHPMLQVLLGGVCGAFLAGDLFNLYVWFEVMLISSFALLVLGGEGRQLDGAVKYVALNLVATVTLLSAVGLLYGMTGTLNLADLHLRLQSVENQGLVTTVAVLFLVAFGIKAAVFPLFFWLPASYHTPPVAVSAVFSGLLTKVGVYAMIRLFSLVFSQNVGYTHTLILAVAGLTMATGVLGAASQNDVRRILSFHIVSQIGYMIMGLGLFTPLALAGSVFYIVHHIIVKANLFLVAGAARRLAGSENLGTMGGLYRSSPALALLFLIPAFSLAGLPPLSGFWAKFILIKAGAEVEAYAIVATALVVGLLTVFSMTKIWAEAFWKPHPAGTAAEGAPATPEGSVSRLLLVPSAALTALTVAIGLWASPLFELATRAAAELLDPAAYVSAVLRGAL